MVEHSPSTTSAGQRINVQFVDDQSEVARCVSQNDHASLVPECSRRSQPSCQKLKVWFQLRVWILTIPLRGATVDELLGCMVLLQVVVVEICWGVMYTLVASTADLGGLLGIPSLLFYLLSNMMRSVALTLIHGSKQRPLSSHRLEIYRLHDAWRSYAGRPSIGLLCAVSCHH